MRMPRLLLLGLAAASAFATAPAHAVTRCAGEQSLLYVCATTPSVGTTTRTYCVYAGGSTCTPVDLPYPVVTGSVSTTCGGILAPANCNIGR
jgi:hypothetical protein